MNYEEMISMFKKWYGPAKGMQVYITVMPGIMADFNRLMEKHPGVMVSEEYKLEDGKGSVVLSGRKKKDGTAEIVTECRECLL